MMDQELLHTPQDKWNKRFVATENNNEWLDTESNQIFGYNNRDEPYPGGWFNFNTNTQDWLNDYAIEFFNQYFGPRHKYDDYDNLILSPEIIITGNPNFQKFNNSSILVIGGGPSSKELDLEKICKYDYVFSCNYFYKTKKFKDIKVDLLLLSHQVDLKDPALTQYIERFNPLVGFEHSDLRGIDVLNQFKNNGVDVFLFLTRHFSRLGYTSRAILLAALLGAKKIDYAGLDGFLSNDMKIHTFEDKKNPPPFYDAARFEQQAFVFWHHLFSLNLNVEYNNLGEDSKYNAYKGIKQNARNRD
jgi:hypothetical protein